MNFPVLLKKSLLFFTDSVILFTVKEKWFSKLLVPYNGVLAQLGEHLPYKQRVIGSSPIGPI